MGTFGRNQPQNFTTCLTFRLGMCGWHQVSPSCRQHRYSASASASAAAAAGKGKLCHVVARSAGESFLPSISCFPLVFGCTATNTHRTPDSRWQLISCSPTSKTIICLERKIKTQTHQGTWRLFLRIRSEGVAGGGPILVAKRSLPTRRGNLCCQSGAAVEKKTWNRGVSVLCTLATGIRPWVWLSPRENEIYHCLIFAYLYEITTTFKFRSILDIALYLDSVQFLSSIAQYRFT